MTRAVFEPAIPATKRPQTYALDRAATAIGYLISQCEQSLNYSMEKIVMTGNYDSILLLRIRDVPGSNLGYPA
jgi:hypothetical protein